MPLDPPTALVTGASAGLGRELVRRLVLDRGMTVWATARRLDRLEALRDDLPAGRVRIHPGDIADPSFRAELHDRAEAESGGIGLLINNAGVGHYADFADQDPAEIRRIVEVNVMAVFDLTARAIRAMRPRGAGEVVVVSSVLGSFGIPFSAAYVASKYAVEGMVSSVRQELVGSGIHLWALRPGRFASEFRRVSLAGRGSDTEGEGVEPRTPVGAIAESLIRHLGGRRAFVAPTPKAALMVAVARYLPGPFGLLLKRMGPARFARELGGAVAINRPPSPP